MEFKTIIPPLIRCYFSENLLSTKTPKIRDSTETLLRVWEYIDSLWYKLRGTPAQAIECERMKKEFMELYERAKIREKELEEEPGHKTQAPLYYIENLTSKDEDLFKRSQRKRTI